MRKFSLREAARFPVGNKPLADGGAGREGVEAQKLYNFAHDSDVGVPPSRFPIHNAHFVTAEHFGYFHLSESQIKPPFAEHFPDGLRIGRIPLQLSKIRTFGATNPT